MSKLKNINIAILATHGFEEVELVQPREALIKAGANVKIISPEKKIKSWNFKNWGKEYDADIILKDANPKDFDALLLPGGVINPDNLRLNPEAVVFARHFAEEKKPIAAICHGPWMLTEINMVKGKKLTSYYSIKTDMENAGGEWLDKEVVQDGLLVTSRKPDDIPAFNKQFIDLLEKELVQA